MVMTSKEVINKFSFQDLLAYFFPGIAIILGFTVLAEQFDFIKIEILKFNAMFGLIYLIVGFIAGITFSGISNLIDSLIYILKKKKKPEETWFLNISFKTAVKKKLNDLGFEVDDLSNKDCFAVCSVFVKELLPNAYAYSFRQEGLRLMRTYMLFPTLLWTLNGVFYGIDLVLISKLNGIIFVISSIGLGLLIILNLWSRMFKNRRRTVRNILISFISIDKINQFRGYDQLLHPTKNIVHLADSTKYEDSSNK